MADRFKDVLGVSPDLVIRRMDEAEDDIPLQSPEVDLVIQSVGVVRENVPIALRGPFGEGRVQTLNATLSLSTEVPQDRRGIHMSRIGDLVARNVGIVFENLLEYARALAVDFGREQYGGRSEISVRAPYSFVTPVAGWVSEKDKFSLDTVRLSAGVVDGDVQSATIGMAIDNMTACPCVQQTLKHALHALGKRSDDGAVDTPLMTHSQRCATSVEIVDALRFPSYVDILEALDRAVVRVKNTLPRDHELALVYSAHRRPQFIEDVVRLVLLEVSKLLVGDGNDPLVKVSSVSYESIHSFDIHAVISGRVSEVLKVDG